MAVSVQFENAAERELKQLAESEDKAIPVVLEEAIALKHWVNNLQHAGKRLYVRDSNGALQEVVVK
jgi:predicted transcriptional regulator